MILVTGVFGKFGAGQKFGPVTLDEKEILLAVFSDRAQSAITFKNQESILVTSENPEQIYRLILEAKERASALDESYKPIKEEKAVQSSELIPEAYKRAYDEGQVVDPVKEPPPTQDSDVPPKTE